MRIRIRFCGKRNPFTTMSLEELGDCVSGTDSDEAE